MSKVFFSEGDQIPEWVLFAEDRGVQKTATFGANVIAEKQKDGSVTVWPVTKLREGQALAIISKAGAVSNWLGAPTRWEHAPK